MAKAAVAASAVKAQNNFMRIWYQRRVYKSQRITVITPCLNEEQGIEQVLRRMPEFVDQVIVVDNGSTDRTPDVARSFGAEVIREPVRGYGRAYKRGFAAATGDIIITLDGDHSYPAGRDLVSAGSAAAPGCGFPERVAVSGAG